MFSFKRSDRVSEQIQAEVSDILLRRVKDPKVGFVTVMDVHVTDDLRHAKIFISTLDPEAPIDQVMEGLNRASGFVRSELGKRLRLRYLPKLRFCADQSGEKTALIMQRLDEVREADGHHS